MPFRHVSTELLFVFHTITVLNIGRLCLSEQLTLNGDMKTRQCERGALSEVDASLCMNIDAPEVAFRAMKIVDCRLAALGKQRLECSYLRQTEIFKCKHPMTDNIAKEVLTTLLDIFERCHTSRREYFQAEVVLLLDKLTFSARRTEELQVKVSESKLPLNFLQRIKDIQQDGISVETMVLKKATNLMKKASGIRYSLSDLAIQSKIKDSQRDSFSNMQNCISGKISGEEAHVESRCAHPVHPFGLCLNRRMVDWVFSLTCTSLFLLMIRRMDGERDNPLSILIGTVLFALRAYTSSQNYTTFLEQFFRETLVGYLLLTVMLWVSKLCGGR